MAVTAAGPAPQGVKPNARIAKRQGEFNGACEGDGDDGWRDTAVADLPLITRHHLSASFECPADCDIR